MSKVEIEIKDYLTDEEMREIARTVFAETIKDHFSDEKDIERIVSNISYGMVFRKVDETLSGNISMEDMILEQVKKSIHEISTFHVFRKKDVWDRASSIGQNMLENAIRECSDIISSKVKEIVDELSRDYILDEISENIQNIFQKLIGRDQ